MSIILSPSPRQCPSSDLHRGNVRYHISITVAMSIILSPSPRQCPLSPSPRKCPSSDLLHHGNVRGGFLAGLEVDGEFLAIGLYAFIDDARRQHSLLPGHRRCCSACTHEVISGISAHMGSGQASVHTRGQDRHQCMHAVRTGISAHMRSGQASVRAWGQVRYQCTFEVRSGISAHMGSGQAPVHTWGQDRNQCTHEVRTGISAQ